MQLAVYIYNISICFIIMWFNIKYISSFEHTLWLKHRCYEVLKLGNFKTEIFIFLKVSHPIESREFYINYMIMQVFFKKCQGARFRFRVMWLLYPSIPLQGAALQNVELKSWSLEPPQLKHMMYWCKLYLLICQHLRECLTFGSKDYHTSNTWLYVDKRTNRIFN